MISATSIEYVTRYLFKGKPLKSICKKFIKDFGNDKNVFIGEVNFTADELYQAVLTDKAKQALSTEPAKVNAKLESLAGYFNLSLTELTRSYNELK